MWEDAMRVARENGGSNAYNQIVYAYAVALGGEAGINLLVRKGIITIIMHYEDFSAVYKKRSKAPPQHAPGPPAAPTGR